MRRTTSIPQRASDSPFYHSLDANYAVATAFAARSPETSLYTAAGPLSLLTALRTRSGRAYAGFGCCRNDHVAVLRGPRTPPRRAEPLPLYPTLGAPLGETPAVRRPRA